MSVARNMFIGEINHVESKTSSAKVVHSIQCVYSGLFDLIVSRNKPLLVRPNRWRLILLVLFSFASCVTNEFINRCRNVGTMTPSKSLTVAMRVDGGWEDSRLDVFLKASWAITGIRWNKREQIQMFVEHFNLKSGVLWLLSLIVATVDGRRFSRWDTVACCLHRRPLLA